MLINSLKTVVERSNSSSMRDMPNLIYFGSSRVMMFTSVVSSTKRDEPSSKMVDKDLDWYTMIKSFIWTSSSSYPRQDESESPNGMCGHVTKIIGNSWMIWLKSWSSFNLNSDTYASSSLVVFWAMFEEGKIPPSNGA